MKYSDFLDILTKHAEEPFADFQRRLIFTNYKIMGVRTPTLRRLAKEYHTDFEDIFTFPNEYYEVVAIKLFQAENLPYEQFIPCLGDCVSWMDNWALCDGFKAKCIKQHKDDFLPVLQTLFDRGGEYEQRYPLVVLLTEYIEPSYLTKIVSFIEKADTSRYYVHMAVAWLVAEIIVKFPEYGKKILLSGYLDKKTHNKAIQKARESYRINKEEKEFLNSLKIK